MPAATLSELRHQRPTGGLPWLLGHAERQPDQPLAIDLEDVVHTVVHYHSTAFLQRMLLGLAASIVAWRSPYKVQVACVTDERIAWGRFLDSAFVVPDARGLAPDALGPWIDEVATLDGRLVRSGATLHPSIRRNRPFDGRPFVDQGPDFSDEVVCIIPDLERLDAVGEVVRFGEARSRGIHLVVGVPIGSRTQSMRESQELIPATITEAADGHGRGGLRAWQRSEGVLAWDMTTTVLDGLLATAGW